MSETKFKKSYLDDGRERNFLVDEKGVEWFYYNDPQTKLIVRALTLEKKDVEEFKTLFKESDSTQLKQEILRIDRTADQKKDIWIVEDKNGNPLCAMDVYFFSDEVIVVYYYTNKVHQNSYEKSVNKVLSNVAKNILRMSMYGTFLTDVVNNGLNKKKKIYVCEWLG